MSRILCLMLILAMLFAVAPAMGAAAKTSTVNPVDQAFCKSQGGIYNDDGAGSNFCLWVPGPGWNGDLVIYAHGYMDPNDATMPNGSIPWGQLVIQNNPDPLPDVTLPQVLGGMGYAFAVPSYSKTGLAVQEGIQAVNNLATMLKGKIDPVRQLPARVYLVGASEGGLVTAKAIEQNYNNLFSGGVTTCGPVGDFPRQVNYWGDFRVLFDYFFPGFKPVLGSPVKIKPEAIASWGTIEAPGLLMGQISQAIATNPGLSAQLIATSNAPIDSNDKAASTIMTSLGLLDYNIKATNDGVATLGGQPFDNNPRLYLGSSNDLKLNLQVQRFNAASAAVNAMKAYQTTGQIKAPLVAMHTTGDPIVPYWHELLYQLKIWFAGKGSQFLSIPIVRYGHCQFTPEEAIFAFAVMVYKATGTIPLALLSPQADNPYEVLTLDEYQALMTEAEKNMPLYGPEKVYVPMLTK